MSKEVKVSKVILKIDGKEIELSLESARELKDVLNDMLGSPPIMREVERYPYVPYIPWYVPERKSNEPYWKEWKITWGTGTSNPFDTVYLSQC